ncbi:alpha/beta hydrolase [Guptibacillus algicola]|uniref:alpha/beta hydrolase n=1 Tax=Guptibacillus algicola TaxID=225844 RepID=UPI001CD20AAE|nr:alpha/beta hydrolase [Alkalihalobacillus algicola]MCA0987627.1 alpha/beta hydrolase [Alkalihalobacillus algicola]
MTEITKNRFDYYVERVGQGEPIIFLPAGGFSGNEGLNIAEHLKEEYETHLIDLPGLGKSSGIEGKVTSLQLADWINRYMEQQNIEKANFIGHSLGGAVLLSFAVHYPHKVNKLILLDQGHKPFPRVPTSEFGLFAYAFPLLNVGVKLFGESFLSKLAPLFTQENEQEVNEIPFDDNVTRFCEHVHIKENHYVRTALKHQSDFSVQGLKLMFGYYDLNLPRLLKKVDVPTYLVYGTFESVNEKEYRNTKQYIQKIKKHNLPIKYYPVQGGHYVHWSEDFSLSEVKEFLTDADGTNRVHYEKSI